MKHWLEELVEENNTTIYQVAKKGNMVGGQLYQLVNRNTPIGKIGLSTADGIAKGLGITIIEFLERYYEKYNQ